MPHYRFRGSPSRKRKTRGDSFQQKEDQWHCSVSQSTIHQDSLCNVSGYEVNAHCRGSLPELFSCDGRSVKGWLCKEGMIKDPIHSSLFRRERKDLKSSPHTSEIKMELDDNYINLADLEFLHLALKRNTDKDIKSLVKKVSDKGTDKSRGRSLMSMDEVETSKSSFRKVKQSESRKLRLERFLSDVDEDRLNPPVTPKPDNENLDEILEQLRSFIQSNKMDNVTENQRAQLIDYLTILNDEYDNKIQIGNLRYQLKDNYKDISNC